MAKDILVGFGIDVDAVAGWLGSTVARIRPTIFLADCFAGEVGSPRLLKLFERFGIKTHGLFPGHPLKLSLRRCKPSPTPVMRSHPRLQS